MTDTTNNKSKVAKAFRHLDPNQGLAGGITASFPTIGYKGKFWTLKYGGTNYPFKRADDGTPLSYIEGVIVGVNSHVSKAYFAGAWSEESSSGPVCYATDGEVPDPGVPDRQSETCGICPQNIWYTKPDGGRGKNCQDHKRLALLLMPDMTKNMFGPPLKEPVHLKIPPGSFKTLKKYSDELQSEGTPYAAVITRISFTPEKQFEMNFKTVGYLGDKEAEVVIPLLDNSQTKAILGTTTTVRAIAPPTKAPASTGLLEAFGASTNTNGNGQPAPTRTRGRPRVPPTIENEPQQAKPSPPVKAAKPEEAQDETDWEESDTDLDDTVNKLMGDKMSKMLPK